MKLIKTTANNTDTVIEIRDTPLSASGQPLVVISVSHTLDGKELRRAGVTLNRAEWAAVDAAAREVLR